MSKEWAARPETSDGGKLTSQLRVAARSTMETLVQSPHRRSTQGIGMIAAAAVALGLALSAAVDPAHAGKIATNKMWPTAGSKTTPNPVRPKAIRDHRLQCRQLAPKPGACPRRPYRP